MAEGEAMAFELGIFKELISFCSQILNIAMVLNLDHMSSGTFCFDFMYNELVVYLISAIIMILYR